MMKIRYKAFILGLLIGGFIACCSCSQPLPKGPTSIGVVLDKKFASISYEACDKALLSATKQYDFFVWSEIICGDRREYIGVKNNEQLIIYLKVYEENKTALGLYAENYDRDYDDILLLVANELKK